jgi:uncharacterized protein (TIGR00725 family)
MSDTQIVIGVIGGGSQVSKEVAAHAYAAGQAIAENGAWLLSGGMGGVMEEACRGAKHAGGRTLGILPGDSREQANGFVDVPILTGLGHARNVIIARSSMALVALPGSYGTLTEIAFALDFKIPVAGIGAWTFERPDFPADPIRRFEAADKAAAWAVAEARKRLRS